MTNGSLLSLQVKAVAAMVYWFGQEQMQDIKRHIARMNASEAATWHAQRSRSSCIFGWKGRNRTSKSAEKLAFEFGQLPNDFTVGDDLRFSLPDGTCSQLAVPGV